MPYCSLADVNALVPQAPFTPSSKPTDVVVTALIADIADEMDATLASVGYGVPVTGALALRLVRKINAYGALGIAQASRDTGVTTAVNAQAKEVCNIWTQLYEKRMAALANPQDPFQLSDAIRTTDPLSAVGLSSVQSVSDDQWLDPSITRNQVL